MEIIIDQDDGKFNGEVEPSQAKITSNPKIPIFTTDLKECVGLAIVERESPEILKRGLAHIHYLPDLLSRATDDRDEYTMIPKPEELIGLKCGLDNFISDFKDPRAIMVFNSFKKNKIGNLENPMANFIFYHLIDRGVIFYSPSNLMDQKLTGKFKEKKKYFSWGDDFKTYSKNVGLHNDRIAVMHFSVPKSGATQGKWLNKKDTIIPLDLNL